MRFSTGLIVFVNKKSWSRWKLKYRKKLTRLDDMTRNQCVSSKFRQTIAVRSMVVDFAFCVYTTRSRARISTFIIETCFVHCTIAVRYTFWSATSIRITEILGKTCTRSDSILFATKCVSATWWRITRMPFFLNRWHWNVIVYLRKGLFTARKYHVAVSVLVFVIFRSSK